ncbi:hypothetical protein J3Q64DRAFT_1752675 [Phycomyces blakesleeanus]|uniref:Secreted protein n=1 Tax=Phycomyces blakesleeanus TaxID=4837 RepID=A0ABR3AVR0_PHYBL
MCKRRNLYFILFCICCCILKLFLFLLHAHQINSNQFKSYLFWVRLSRFIDWLLIKRGGGEERKRPLERAEKYFFKVV